MPHPVLPHDVTAADLLALVNSNNLDQLLRRRLETSGIFGARFRECAGRALLLTRPNFKKRMPLWMSRLRSQKLFHAVRQYDDFPILLETWRTCLQDEFDLEGLRRLLVELETGTIAWSEIHSSQASPMAQQMAWGQVNKYMYMDDTPDDDRPSQLSGDLLQEIVHSPTLRPSVSQATAAQFEAKSLRLIPGYAPTDSDELVEWVKERLLIPASEWQALVDLMAQTTEQATGDLLQQVAPRLARLHPPKANEAFIVAREMLPPIMTALPWETEAIKIEPIGSETDGLEPARDFSGQMDGDDDRAAAEVDLAWLLSEWLQFYGPKPVDFIAGTLGIEEPQAASYLDLLVDDNQLISGELIKKEAETVYCDARNFEMLLRLERRASQPVIEPRPCEALAPFLARVQGLMPGTADRQDQAERLLGITEQMCGFSLAAHLWEGEVLPVRMPGYDPAWLDSLMQTTDLMWIGRPNRNLTFCFQPDLDLLIPHALTTPNKDNDHTAPGEPIPDTIVDEVLNSAGRFDFSTLVQLTGISPADAAHALWEGVWQGIYSNDAFAAMRQGLVTGFKPPRVAAARRTGIRSRRGGGRIAFSRWKAARPQAGNWFKITWPEPAGDVLSEQELQRDRIRLLLNRYGILFRELLVRELPMFRWASLLRTLRLMDLSGEIYSGSFFKGIAGLQFISLQSLSLLQHEPEGRSIYWLNAADPASVCGLGLQALGKTLPRRIESSHLVYRGAEVIVTSRRRGRHMQFNIPPDDPDIAACLGFLHHLLNRAFQPLRHITIETINDQIATESPYLPVFMDGFDVVRDPRSITLYRRLA